MADLPATVFTKFWGVFPSVWKKYWEWKKIPLLKFQKVKKITNYTIVTNNIAFQNVLNVVQMVGWHGVFFIYDVAYFLFYQRKWKHRIGRFRCPLFEIVDRSNTLTLYSMALCIMHAIMHTTCYTYRVSKLIKYMNKLQAPQSLLLELVSNKIHLKTIEFTIKKW